MSKNLPRILERYKIVFTTVSDFNDVPVFSSSNSYLSSLFNANNTSGKAAALNRNIREISRQRKAEISLSTLTDTGTITIQAYAEDRENTDVLPPLFLILTSDMLAVAIAWYQFVYRLVSRSVEIKDGQGIIRIVSDDSCNALIINKPVAVNWPDNHGSIGEYYTVSNYPDDQQKSLTKALDEILVSGSNKQILDEVSTFLNLFSTGTYDVSIGEITREEAVICHDNCTEYGESVKPEERFTCSFYPSREDNMFLFSRSYGSIDKTRVEYYVNLLLTGSRPKVIVYTHYLHQDHFPCRNYIIDGHHKFLAYLQLKIDIHAVFISKNDYEGTFDDDIITVVHNVLKPHEFRHYFLNSSEENIGAFMHPEATKIFDDFLTNERNIDTSITTVIYKAYHSEEPLQREWIEKRLVALSRNKYAGNGQFLYFSYFEPQIKHKMWNQLSIRGNSDFEVWKSVYLEDQPLPMYIKQRLVNDGQMRSNYNPRPQKEYVPKGYSREQYKSGLRVGLTVLRLLRLIFFR